MHRARIFNPIFAFTSVVFIIAVSCLASSVTAQTGSVKGKIKNMNGDGIGEATVIARLGTKDILTAKSNNKGDFILSDLDAGTYSIFFDARGYSAGVKSGVEVKAGKTKDLGGNLILFVDRGSQVIVEGSVYYKNGTSLAGAEIRVERINADGSIRKVTTGITDYKGEFSFRQSEGKAKFRFTATHKGVSGTKEIEVETTARYRFSIILDVEREKN